MNEKLFGTDGVRGVANLAPMDSETVMRLGRAAAHVLRRSRGHHRILIGKDTRLSGYMLETALASGITSMGVDVLLVGPLPTPGIAYMTKSMRADAGVVISASHNGYEDNGIKFFGGDGFKLADQTEAEIERLMEPGHLDELRAVPGLIGKAARIDDAIGRYAVFLKEAVSREISFEGLTLALDAANGAAYKVAPLVFQELGAKLSIIGDEPNGTNINDQCGSLYPQAVANVVVQNKTALGIAFDGDADRVIICDENGKVIDGDLILAILAHDWIKRGKLKSKTVVGTVMSNYGFEKSLAKLGLSLARADVGDRYVLAEMQKLGANLGGEQSGHVIALDHNTTGDGILTSLLVLEAMRRADRPLSDFHRLIERFPQVLLNIAVTRKIPFMDLPKVSKVVAAAEKKLKDRGRLLLRYSGTESKARVMVEADDQLICQAIAQEVAEVVQAELAATA
ncbi:phosphoglucosamine mutase [bacterium]|nr:phosphoglucosamine mutase [bacterium]